MKKLMTLILASCSLFMLQCANAENAATQNSPLGHWQTIDDVTGKPKAVIEITETANKTLSGKVVKIFPRPGYDQNEVCTACEGDKHNQRIVGMVIMQNLKQSEDNKETWAEGEF